jgi:hypothetical protein
MLRGGEEIYHNAQLPTRPCQAIFEYIPYPQRHLCLRTTQVLASISPVKRSIDG